MALMAHGVVEASEMGQVFCSHNIHFLKCYTSVLTRSIITAHRTLEAAGVTYMPIRYGWRWNEHHYGALQGLSKERTAVRLGKPTVMRWRRSYGSRPPPMREGHPHYDIIHRDAGYRAVRHEIPQTESLEDCQRRVVRAWDDTLLDILRLSGTPRTAATTTTTTTAGGSPSSADDGDVNDDSFRYSLVVAHANTLRALVMYLDDISPNEIEGLNIATAIPFYYDIDMTTFRVVASSPGEDGDVGGGQRDDDENDGDKKNERNKKNNGESVGGVFRGTYVTDDRKKWSFLEWRRSANDPWLWALHDHQVSQSMLLQKDGTEEEEQQPLQQQQRGGIEEANGDLLDGLEEEAEKNTVLFSSALNRK